MVVNNDAESGDGIATVTSTQTGDTAEDTGGTGVADIRDTVDTKLILLIAAALLVLWYVEMDGVSL